MHSHGVSIEGFQGAIGAFCSWRRLYHLVPPLKVGWWSQCRTLLEMSISRMITWKDDSDAISRCDYLQQQCLAI